MAVSGLLMMVWPADADMDLNVDKNMKNKSAAIKLSDRLFD